MTETVQPVDIRTGADLAKALKVSPDEGVLVALLPDTLETVYSQEVPYYDRDDKFCHAVIADCGPWGHRMIDLQAPSGEDIKWWRVKEARPEGIDLIPIRWQGPIGELPERYLEKDGVVAIRFYQHGPFFFPKEKPVVRSETAEKETLEEAVAAVAEGVTNG